MKKIGFCFGGPSVEHEVSVISGIQAALAIDTSQYQAVPIYVSKNNSWFTGEALLDIDNYKRDVTKHKGVREVFPQMASNSSLQLIEKKSSWFSSPKTFSVDIMFLAFHGSYGENGAFQGLCESWGIPYTGSGLLGSSLSMDKEVSKIASLGADIPIVDYTALKQVDWLGKEEDSLNRIEALIPYPIVVKPARLGSSIGISICQDRPALDSAIEDAFRYDSKLVLESGIKQLKEINCSVLGWQGSARTSVLEQPVREGEEGVLSFEDKYQRGSGKQGGSKSSSAEGMASLDRIIPAPIDPELTETIRSLSLKVFNTFECSGVCRIDFMIDEENGQHYFNEINTIPGSLSFYLWEASGLTFQELVTEMIEIALKRFEMAKSKVLSYDTNLLETSSFSGSKGSKG